MNKSLMVLILITIIPSGVFASNDKGPDYQIKLEGQGDRIDLEDDDLDELVEEEKLKQLDGLNIVSIRGNKNNKVGSQAPSTSKDNVDLKFKDFYKVEDAIPELKPSF